MKLSDKDLRMIKATQFILKKGTFTLLGSEVPAFNEIINWLSLMDKSLTLEIQTEQMKKKQEIKPTEVKEPIKTPKKKKDNTQSSENK